MPRPTSVHCKRCNRLTPKERYSAIDERTETIYCSECDRIAFGGQLSSLKLVFSQTPAGKCSLCGGGGYDASAPRPAMACELHNFRLCNYCAGPATMINHRNQAHRGGPLRWTAYLLEYDLPAPPQPTLAQPAYSQPTNYQSARAAPGNRNEWSDSMFTQMIFETGGDINSLF